MNIMINDNYTIKKSAIVLLLCSLLAWLAVSLAVSFGVRPVAAQNQLTLRPVEGIAAIVNDEVISIYDVDQRVGLFLATSGIPRTPENIDRIRGQVLRSLIDEKMQLQEAAEAKIDISAAEIDDALLNMTRGGDGNLDDIKKFLAENGIQIATMRDQIHAELAWRAFVRYRFSGRVNVSEAEIDETLERALAAVNQARVNVSEILLLVDNPNDENRLMTLAAELVTQLRTGVDFAAIARQFSGAASAAAGGRIGWVTLDQMDPILAANIANLQEGAISEPIRTSAGIYILLVGDRQQSGAVNPQRHLFDIIVLSFDNASETLDAQLSKTRAAFTTCKAAEAMAQENGALNIQRSDLNELGAFNVNLREVLLPLEAGSISQPIRKEQTTELIIVCDRKDDQGVQISRQQIENNIYSQRLSIMARRHLRELRRDAVVEYR